MGLQLIFAVETNKACKSDWIYIKDTISRFYTIDQAHIKLSTVYMDGKSNYTKKQKEVNNILIFQRITKAKLYTVLIVMNMIINKKISSFLKRQGAFVKIMNMSLYGSVKILKECI